MQIAPLPENERDRLRTLKDLEILDTHLEKVYDEITHLAAQICDVPICLISLVDENRQWFKSKVGIEADETPRDLAFCAHAILDDEILEVPDTHKDERFADNPLVTNDPHISFYAGAPIKMMNQHKVGTLCVIDKKPRRLTPLQRETLKTLANQVVAQFELRKQLKLFQENNNKLKDLNLAKTKFYASVNHEVRTTLNSIVTIIELLKDTAPNSEQKEYLDLASISSDNMTTILNDILDMSKMEANKLTILEERFNVKTTLGHVFQIFTLKAERKNLNFGITIDDDIPNELIGDSTRIQQILINLLSNALKFTEKGGIDIYIKGKQADNPEDYILAMSVCDTGIGISKECQHKLFHEFAQAEKNTHANYGGTGLGLHIVKTLTQMMNGDVSLESDTGKGATFTVTLKLKNI